MPRYEYECEVESRTFDVQQSFQDEVLVTCPDCGGKLHKNIVGIQWGFGTSITKKGAKEAEYSAKFEKQLEKDRPAYKAMKDQGLKPGRLSGAHELMIKAETKFEIESGKLMPGKAKEIESAVKEFKDFTGRNVNESSAVRL